MKPLSFVLRHYDWGSPDEICRILGCLPQARPVAEAWFGAHPSAPSITGTDERLDEVISAAPDTQLGVDAVERFGPNLPYLLKLISVARPLSLQVHPDVVNATAGFLREEAAGLPLDDPRRMYKDRNAKPEMVVALTRFEALCGFSAPQDVVSLLSEVNDPLIGKIVSVLAGAVGREQVMALFGELVSPNTRPAAVEVQAAADACALVSDPRCALVTQLVAHFGPDPGAVAALLLERVVLDPGEALFIPVGGVHAYLSGLGLEVMANSDNVLRAGLTSKYVDVGEFMANVAAVPPARITPLRQGSTELFRPPVSDFLLTISDLDGLQTKTLTAGGPRIILCLSGHCECSSGAQNLKLVEGEAIFVPATVGPLLLTGTGRVVQASVNEDQL